MFSNRIPFVLIGLFLVMIITVSTAPVHEHEDIPTEYEESTTSELIKATSDLPDVVTDGLLFVDVTAVPLDKNIKTDDDLLYYRKGAILITPKPDESRSFTIETPRVTMNITYNAI